jgi:hypothetical protein
MKTYEGYYPYVIKVPDLLFRLEAPGTKSSYEIAGGRLILSAGPLETAMAQRIMVLEVQLKEASGFLANQTFDRDQQEDIDDLVTDINDTLKEES